MMGSLYGMENAKDGLEMLAQDGSIKVPQPVVQSSLILTNIQNMPNNTFPRTKLLIDQEKMIIEHVIEDQEWILAGCPAKYENAKPSSVRSITNISRYLAVAKRLQMNKLLGEYIKILQATKQ
jgi:hypothetical protein